MRKRHDTVTWDGIHPQPLPAEKPGRGRSPQAAAWIARIAVGVVFCWNVACALQFVTSPLASAAGYGLPATEESAALVAGMGVAFLMWNATYPAVIASPRRFPALFAVVLAQQAIGLVGETGIWLHLVHAGLGGGLMAAGILRFMLFDGAGLAMMLAAFIFLRLCPHRQAPGTRG